ncbi:MAG: DUF58 domain-containing protein [Actinomycetota bacterium]|nr:DUF58 domain-containing protein [Actinomycetota bacterium]
MLGPDDLALLSRVSLVYRHPHRGLNPGERRSPRFARSAEFADFRPYVAGDDLRQIDWRAFARSDRLMVRLYVAEDEAALNVVVDDSASMQFGSPSKWSAAQRLATAVAFLGLATMDRVAIGTLAPPGAHIPHARRGGGTGRLLRFLPGRPAAGGAGPDDLGGLRWLKPGLTVVISDFLVDAPWSNALAMLRAARQQLVLWQVLSPEEEHPRLSGDVRLRDAESRQGQEMTITPRVIDDYRHALAQHRQGLRRQAAAVDGRFLHTLSSDDLQRSMLGAMAAGIIGRA